MTRNTGRTSIRKAFITRLVTSACRARLTQKGRASDAHVLYTAGPRPNQQSLCAITRNAQTMAMRAMARRRYIGHTLQRLLQRRGSASTNAHHSTDQGKPGGGHELSSTNRVRMTRFDSKRFVVARDKAATKSLPIAAQEAFQRI